MARLAFFTLALACSAGCEFENPCIRLADYVCDCRADDPDFDCEEFQRIADGATADIYDDCVIDLLDLQDEDDENGETCDV